MYREEIGPAGDGKNPQYPLLRRGEQQVALGAPRLLLRKHQGGQTARVDELQACQVDDDHPLPAHNRRERSRDARSVCYVKLPAQRDDSLTVAFAGTQIHADHESAFLLQQQGGVSIQRLVRQFSPSTLRRTPAIVLTWAMPVNRDASPSATQPAAAARDHDINLNTDRTAEICGQ
jgi:hypothetical protein